MATSNVYPCEPGEKLEPEDREKLIIENLPLVHWIASRLHENLPPSIPLEDLVSTGIVGLIAAIDNFDPRYKVKLGSYAHHRIRGAMLDSIRGLDGISGPNRQRMKKVEAAISKIEQRVQRAASEEEICSELGIPMEEYQGWLVDLQGVKMDTLESGEDNAPGLLNLLASEGGDTPGQKLERSELERVLTEGIDKLPKRERLVLSLYYKEELTLREIADVMDLHLTRISQLKAQGILRLRAYLERYWPMNSGVTS
jgi:RNA polymerase sigma factor for flagellar operon FliA